MKKGLTVKDFRNMSIAEAIADPECSWGLTTHANPERDARKARWERRKKQKDAQGARG